VAIAIRYTERPGTRDERKNVTRARVVQITDLAIFGEGLARRNHRLGHPPVERRARARGDGLRVKRPPRDGATSSGTFHDRRRWSSRFIPKDKFLAARQLDGNGDCHRPLGGGLGLPQG